jgi:RNA polymerase sigma factor (sigma-70 family)
MGVTPPPFQVLLDSERDHVYRFLVAAVGPTDADDCFQETFIAALRAYPRLRHGANLRAWLLKIAKRKALDSRRSHVRHPVPVATVPERPSAGDHAGPDVLAAVGRLPEKQRIAVLLRHLVGSPYPEVAEVLECSQDAARRSVHEGLSKLREEWTDD